MRIDRLILEDFRNYERVETAFSPGLNLVVGSNAQGKTNLLEAIYCLSGFGSPRAPDAALVRDGCERAVVHAEVVRGRRALRVDLELRPGRGARALVNRTPVPSARSLSETVVSVFFGPDELSLVKGSPEGRRRFLDDLVVKLRPARHSLRREWERILRQRNALLKSAPGRRLAPSAAATLEVWDEAFCSAGAAFAAARLSALASLLPHAQKRYEAIAGGGRLELEYQSSWLDDELGADALATGALPDEPRLREALRTRLVAERDRELERGMSLSGPQRDDVAVALLTAGGGILDARTFASQGDQRTASLALKLGEFDLLADAVGEEPVLLLDDVFSELDPARRGWLADSIRDVGQAILTSAEPGAAEAAGPAKVLQVRAGEVSVRA